MGQTKIRAFKGLRDGKEDPVEYIEDIEWNAERQLKQDGNESASEADKTHRLLFRQNLEADAYDWYSDLDKATKSE